MPGVGLSAAGWEEAAGLRARLGPVGHVVSSPVQRARETASVLGEHVEVEPGVEEIDFGGWTGMRFDALAGDPVWRQWNGLRSLVRCPGGETMAEAQARALGAVGRLRAAWPGGVVAVVSHADVVKAVLAGALGVSLDQLDRLAVGPASISTLVVWEGGMRVECVNR